MGYVGALDESRLVGGGDCVALFVGYEVLWVEGGCWWMIYLTGRLILEEALLRFEVLGEGIKRV